MPQYTQLKQVVNIDDRITNLHNEMVNLYAKRARLIHKSGISSVAATPKTDSLQLGDTDMGKVWIVPTYALLASAWLKYGIIIPAITEISTKLTNAQRVIQTITTADPNLGPQLGVLLVPPSSQMSFPIPGHMRRTQADILLDDYINPELAAGANLTHKKAWQLLVVDTSSTGQDYGGGEQILKYKKYMIAGYDMRSLGLRQYAALSLQTNQTIDQNVWTILLGDRYINNALIPSATCINGQYRFELDEPNSSLGDERFRPALEIKG